MRIRVEELEPKGHQVLNRRYYYPGLMIRIIDAPIERQGGQGLTQARGRPDSELYC